MIACFLQMLVFCLYRLLAFTVRIKVIGEEYRERVVQDHQHGSFILALWHQNLYASVMAHAHQGISPIISLSRDGSLVTYACRKLGYEPIRGSTSRGGEQAKKDAAERLRGGGIVAITVDGPKGPFHKVKRGIIDIARETGTGILPMLTLGQGSWRLKKSWDHGLIPKPFSKVVVCYGEPIFPDSSELGSQKQELMNRLNRLEETATQAFAQW